MAATPVPEAEPAETYADVDASDPTDEAAPLPWILTGLTGAGALLAGGLWLRLRRRRASGSGSDARAEPAADWQQHVDAAGHLHADLTVPRGTLGAVDATSLLPDPDVVYVTQTANTPDDLAELDPFVSAETTALVKDSDPTLDQDLADWRADTIDRPRLTVLGPVRTRLGPNPRTGRPYLPDARKNAEAGLRAVGVCLIEDLLSDADLFRRLRLLGESSGVHGIDHLAEALRLVTGAPYEQLRSRGGLWLADARDDQRLLVGIIDIAHLLTHALAAGALQRARGAAELAHAVAPYEEGSPAGSRGHRRA